MLVVGVLAGLWWAAMAVLGGAYDMGGGIPGRAADGALMGLAVGAPLAAAAIWLTRRRVALGPGRLAMAGGVLLTGLSFASILWARDPALAWVAANRQAILVCALAIGLALGTRPSLARRFPAGLSVAAIIPVGAVLATYVFPATLGTDAAWGRLSAPIGYPNVVALVAAAALPGALLIHERPASWWNVAPRGAWTAALITTAVLSVSRSGIVAAIVASGLAVALSHRARHAAGLLTAGALGAALPVAFGLRSHALTADGLPAAARADDGRVVGVLLVAGMMLAAAAAVPLTRLAERPRVRRARTVVALVAVLAAAAPLVAVGLDASAITGCAGAAVGNDTGRITEVGTNQRGAWWCQAARGVRAEPVLGNGAGSFPLVQRLHRDTGVDTQRTVDPHQVFLGPASDLGGVGLALVLAMWVAGGWAVLRLRRAVPAGAAAILAAGAVQSLTDYTLSWPAGGVPVMAALGIVTAAAAHARAPRLLPASREGMLAGWLAVACLAALVSAALPWWSMRLAAQSADARVAGDIPAALDRARTAADLNPLALQPLWQRGTALLAAGDHRGAVEAFQEATRVQPDNPEAWKRLAIVLGTDPTARLAWLQVHRLDPHDGAATQALLGSQGGPAGSARVDRRSG